MKLSPPRTCSGEARGPSPSETRALALVRLLGRVGVGVLAAVVVLRLAGEPPLEHHVHLLEGLVLGLGEVPAEQEPEAVDDREGVEGLEAHVSEHDGREHRNEDVADPVGVGGGTNSLRAVLHGEHLRAVRPHNWSPAVAEVEDEEADGPCGDPLRPGATRILLVDCRIGLTHRVAHVAHEGKDGRADGHARRGPHQEDAAPLLVHEEDRWEGTEDVHNAGHSGEEAAGV
mmetsp:Transcript_52857/g.136482  ORF Transcript_52857/g.136482 Transcript_52857/m.136482 type:complete len:230 (-) Transcript_52857:1071-1760(-)